MQSLIPPPFKCTCGLDLPGPSIPTGAPGRQKCIEGKVRTALLDSSSKLVNESKDRVATDKYWIQNYAGEVIMIELITR